MQIEMHKNLCFISLTSSDPAVHALQFLDVINMKDPTQKAHFYRSTLKDALPFIPRVSGVNINEKLNFDYLHFHRNYGGSMYGHFCSKR